MPNFKTDPYHWSLSCAPCRCERQGLVETSLVCCSCMFILHSRFSPQSESDKSFALKIVAPLPLLFRVSPLLPLHSAAGTWSSVALHPTRHWGTLNASWTGPTGKSWESKACYHQNPPNIGSSRQNYLLNSRMVKSTRELRSWPTYYLGAFDSQKDFYK